MMAEVELTEQESVLVTLAWASTSLTSENKHSHHIIMSLLGLPAELRNAIYQYLEELQPGRHETVAPNVKLTPRICRASRWLRQETLPLYGDEDCYPEGDRISLWLETLGDAIKHVRSFQISRHWNISQPTRYQGHVGFYLRMELIGHVWQMRGGTYPVVKDRSGMRMESVELLQYAVRENVLGFLNGRERQQLHQLDIRYIASAMDLVALHPISTFDLQQSEAGRQGRRRIWSNMEEALMALRSHEATDIEAVARPQFFTPY
ncbi:hypothetical protein LTR86_002904 [Recurvomyces mirabilis]|nr:hypothetical protein LTR86_002904 [Recurvomyces mirabilis]